MTSSTSTDGRGILTNPYDDAYYVGATAAPDLVLLGVDTAGCLWWTPEPDGWVAPTAVTPMDARAYGDGAYDGPTTFEARALGFGGSETGLCVAPDRATARAALQRLLAVCSSRSEVLYTQRDGDGTWSLRLRATGQPKIRWVEPNVFEFAFSMIAPDPLKFDAAQLAVAVSTGLPVAVGGYRYNLIYPKVYGAGSSGQGSVTVVNRGGEFSQATYAITGPFDHPTVFVASTGAYFTINRVGGALDTVTVDTRTGTVLLNGVSIFGDFEGDFPLIPPGSSQVQWSHQGSYNSTAQLTVSTTSTRR